MVEKEGDVVAAAFGRKGDVIAAAFGRKVMIFLLSSMKIIHYQLPHPPPQRATQVSSVPPFEKLKN